MCYPIVYAEITELFVMQEYRRQGIGRQLMEFMANYLTQQGVSHFHVLTFKNNTVAQALYRSLGFADTSEILLDKNVPLY